MRTILCVLFASAACGGGSKPTTTTTNTDPVPMNEPVANEPSKQTEPTTQPEPAQPAQRDPAQVKAALLAAETAAFEKAKPVFDKYCAKCHSKGGSKASQKKLDHFEMTTYPFGGHHGMAISGEIRKALAIGGGKPTMPMDNKGAVKGDDLALIAGWANAFDASHKGGAHEGHGSHQHGEHKH